MIDEQEIRKAGWNFDNTYASLPGLLYTKLSSVPVNSPKLVMLNETLAESLGLNAQSLKSSEGVMVLAGNRLPEGAEPLAQAYAGHQFGHFTMLGDGRALLLGELVTPEGERYDIQLKGSGKTPYSRGGDGRAALGPMLREYIISEAMFRLGIPTTRSLAVVRTGESIVRETMLPGAILTRIAASHIRVGTFQYVSQWGAVEDLRTLAEYTLGRHYGQREAKNPYLTLLQEVIKRQGSLIAQWQLVGFIHGVMNTDNMVVSGETIDYGPCAFMDTYDPATVFSSIDRQGRYAYRNQPYMAAWNLARFAETLLPLLSANEEEAIKIAEAEVSQFFELYQKNWLRGMRAKLGLLSEEAEDESLIKDLLDLMEKHQADYTNTFLALTFDKQEDSALFSSGEFVKWKERWQGRIGRQQEARESSHQLMRNSNPAVIPRNHRVEAALEAAVEEGDYSVLRQLLEVLENPYAHTPEQLEYSQPPEPSSCGYRTFCGT
ncbi:MAG: YdiU family protein [Desulfitobacterium sp.]